MSRDRPCSTTFRKRKTPQTNLVSSIPDFQKTERSDRKRSRKSISLVPKSQTWVTTKVRRSKKSRFGPYIIRFSFGYLEWWHNKEPTTPGITHTEERWKVRRIQIKCILRVPKVNKITLLIPLHVDEVEGLSSSGVKNLNKGDTGWYV